MAASKAANGKSRAGTITWTRRIGDPENQSEIAVWENGSFELLTDNDLKDSAPWINGLGHIAWSRWPGTDCSDAEIYFYDGQTITQVSDNGLSNQSVRLNDNGMITV